MSRRIDKILFKALNDSNNNNATVHDSANNNSTSPLITFQQLNNNIDTILQDAKIIFVDSDERIEDEPKEIFCQTLVNTSISTIIEEPQHPVELLFELPVERMEDEPKDIFCQTLVDTSISTVIEQPQRSVELFDDRSTETVNENMNITDNEKDPDFLLNSENSDNSDSSENISDLQNDKLNADDPQDEIPKIKRSTKYEINKNRWKKNVNSLNREKGNSYKGKKKENGKWRYDLLKEAKSIKGICNCKLSQNKNSVLMCTKITEHERRQIFEEFWRYTWAEKKMFIRNHVNVKKTSRKRGLNEESRRTYSNEFFFGSSRMRICKTMFLNTLGVKEWVIKKWAKSGLDKNVAVQIPQNVGINNRVKQLQIFLESLPKMESHYCRATTSKLYLEPTWTSKSQLYKFYKSDFCQNQNEKAVSIATFHKEFEKNKLSLYRPKKDLCDTCVSFQTGNISEDVYNKHIKFKDEARAEKHNDKQSQNEVFTMDLQSVLLCPKSNVSSLYYKTKLIVHNFTIYDIKRQKGFCFLWNESEGGLTSNEFTSIIVHFLSEHVEMHNLKKRGTDDIQIILWSDGCGYQNRNSTLSNGLLNFTLESGITVIQKYLQKGHTQMEVDSVHSVIERQIRNKKINIPADYVYICKTACHKNPYNVKYLTHDFFKKYDHLQFVRSIRPGKAIAGAPTVNDLRALKYSKDGIFFKLCHAEDWQTLPIRLNISNIVPINSIDLPQLYASRLKIKAEKFQHLQILKLSMERDYHDFYDKLPHEN